MEPLIELGMDKLSAGWEWRWVHGSASAGTSFSASGGIMEHFGAECDRLDVVRDGDVVWCGHGLNQPS